MGDVREAGRNGFGLRFGPPFTHRTNVPHDRTELAVLFGLGSGITLGLEVAQLGYQLVIAGQPFRGERAGLFGPTHRTPRFAMVRAVPKPAQ